MKPIYLSPKTLEDVIKLRAQNLSYRKIAENLNISKGTAYKIDKGIHHQQVNKNIPAKPCPKHGIIHDEIDTTACPDNVRITFTKKRSRPTWKKTPPPESYDGEVIERIVPRKVIEEHVEYRY